MSLKDKLLNTKEITRRTFLKGASAAGATAALYGCGGGESPKSYMEEDTTVSIPSVEGKTYTTTAGHNCGGRCISKAYVENGVVKRITTDERPETNIIDGEEDKSQSRACIKCRANVGKIYRNDRLLHPLKQTKTRGDLSGFVRITWEQALQEVAEKLLSIAGTYGGQSIYKHMTTGDPSHVMISQLAIDYILNLIPNGGTIAYRDDYSHACLWYTGRIFYGSSIPGGALMAVPNQAIQDIFNSDTVILWGANPGEAAYGGYRRNWYLQQFREKGGELIQVDMRVTATSNTTCTDRYAVAPCTDAFFAQAMMHEMIINTWNEDGSLKASPWLDEAFIKAHVHGFFDDPAAASYQDDVPDGTYNVPAGASLSAYILGTDNRLVLAGVNQATSIYPSTIGYNHFDTKDANDPLRTARTDIYGQEAKTPEWAAPKCGISPARIRELAQIIATKKCTIEVSGGMQRNTEGEQTMLSVFALGAITGQFGEQGRNLGMMGPRRKKQGTLYSIGAYDGASNPEGMPAIPLLYDTSKITTPVAPLSPALAAYPMFNAPKYLLSLYVNSIPLVLWADAVKNAGTGESDYNDGQIKRLAKPIKAIINMGGNTMVNQGGQSNKCASILKDSGVELIVISDLYMTPSARYSDYVFPICTGYEKSGAATSSLSDDLAILMNKAIEPLGESKPDYDFLCGLADACGIEPEKFHRNKTIDEWVEDKVTAYLAQNGIDMTFEEWKNEGIASLEGEATVNPTLEAFRNDPANNPLKTPSGKLEVYSQMMVEDYEARGYDNQDRDGVMLVDGLDINGLPIAAALHDGNPYARYVYPIPVCIPVLEGNFADETHPDPLGMNTKGYDMGMCGWHGFKTVHSTHGNNAYINELYKRDINGRPASVNSDRSWSDNIWDDGVYQPVWINPADAVLKGIQDGDRVVIENDRGSIYASAFVTQKIRPGWLGMSEGAWTNGDNIASGSLDTGRPDVGGCLNVLTKLMPSRVAQGCTLNNDTRVRVYKG